MPLNLTAIIAKAVPGEPAAITADDSILIWLNDPANAAKVCPPSETACLLGCRISPVRHAMADRTIIIIKVTAPSYIDTHDESYPP